MKNRNHYAVILAGGTGTRFWPMSRTAYPKQFLDILNTGSTLLQSTWRRFSAFIPAENIYIITSAGYEAIVKEQLPHLPAANIVAEPERKNTAPCVALMAMKLQRLNPLANLIVAPSDHLIENEAAFAQNCLAALEYTAARNAFVTLGIPPTGPNTGYGYIQYEKETADTHIHAVKQFTEKPDKATAAAFLKAGCYLWNAGIFIWKAADIISAFGLYMPDLFRLFTAGLAYLNTADEPAAVQQMYSRCPSISIDYAILEKARNVHVMPAGFGWSDLGTWRSAWENFEKDAGDNAVSGSNTLLVDASGCMIHSTCGKLLVAGGVNDLIIVNTPDALLVCKKENEQQIKDYLEKVRETSGALYL